MEPNRWQTIQAAFDELVALDETSRASRLAALGDTDPELRAAVESLLTADVEASAHLAPLETGLLGEARASPDPLGLVGQAISHFEVQDPLGAGGMGVVYRARDARLGRDVALKFLLPHYSLDASAKARFLREAHAAAALDHPNLCTMHEVGETDDGRLFLAMALYEGETLKARLAREGPLPMEEALDISRQIAQGLAGAHAAGVVHRDLKPGNVMLLADGTVKILDFGLAKARDQSVSETGARFGTVAYMAPEQIRGEPVDARADLWAVGVVLYETVTGQKPFGGDHEVAIVYSVLDDEPVPPSTLRHDVAVVVEDLVLSLLQKDRATRCPTAEELLADLASIETSRPSLVREARKRWRRARHVLAAKGRRVTLAGAALLVGYLGYGAITRNGDGRAPTVDATAIAVLPFRNLSVESAHAYLADGLQAEILTQLAQMSALKVIGRSSVRGYRGPDAPPLRQIGTELGVGSVVDASVQVVGDRLRVHVQLVDPQTGAQRWAERYDRALDDAFAVQSDIAQRIVATVGATLSGAERQRVAAMPTSSAEAYLFYLQGLDYLRQPTQWNRRQFELAEELLTRALALDAGFALAHAALSEMHGQMYRFRHDMTPARLARQRGEAEAALRLAPDLPGAHRAMALVYEVGPGTDLPMALMESRTAVRGAPSDADAWERFAWVHRRLGNWDSSLAAFSKALELDPRDEGLILGHGAWTNTRIGRFEEAIRWLDHALVLWPDHAWAQVARAWTYTAWQGQLDTLRAMMSGLPPMIPELRTPGTVHDLEFLRITRQPDSLLRVLETVSLRVFSHPYFYIPTSLYAAWAHVMRGDRLAAFVAFDSALVVLDSAILELPGDWPVHWARGMTLAGLGRRQEALREAHWLRESVLYREDAFFGPTLATATAELLAHSGEADAAVDEIERALAEGAFGNILQPFAVTVHALRLHPSWDPIREHPRFTAVLAQYERPVS